VKTIFLGVLFAYLLHAVAMHRHTGPAEEAETQLHRGLPAPLMPMALFFACQGLGSPAISAIMLSPVTLGLGGALLLLVMLSQLRRKRQEAPAEGNVERLFYFSGGILQSVLLLMACYYAYQHGALGRGLLDMRWGILGLVAGHLVFGVSLVFSHRSLDSFRDIALYVLDPRSVCGFAARSPRQCFACLDVSLIEELVYRVTAQGMLLSMTGRPGVAIVAAAVTFSLVHRHFFYNHIVDSLEFFVFSVFLGAVFYWTGSLLLVMLIHAVRNLEIIYFDETAKLPEAGLPETAVCHALHPVCGTARIRAGA